MYNNQIIKQLGILFSKLCEVELGPTNLFQNVHILSSTVYFNFFHLLLDSDIFVTNKIVSGSVCCRPFFMSKNLMRVVGKMQKFNESHAMQSPRR